MSNDKRVYNVKDLMKSKPEQIEGFECQKIDGRYQVQINYVLVFAKRYEIVYEHEYMQLFFYDSNNKFVSSVIAYGMYVDADAKAVIIYPGDRIVVDGNQIVCESAFIQAKGEFDKLE